MTIETISMENQRSSLCRYCSDQKFRSAEFWNPPAGLNEDSGECGNRRFGDIKSEISCPMCHLIRDALLSRDTPCLPDDEAEIWYSRVIYGEYSSHDPQTCTQAHASCTPDSSCISSKKTYRLRVSTRFQYNFSPELKDERFFQARAWPGMDKTAYEGEIMLLKKKGDADKLLHGRKLGKSLDIALVKNWISNCSDGCKPKDELQSQSTTTIPLRVIDTREMMIRKTPPDCRYAALSYTWGPEIVPPFHLTRDNEQQLMSSRGLTRFWGEIPRTIQDAISLCSRLDIEYLWVDALCRGEGEGYEHEKVANHLRLIFEKSFLTIVGNGPTSRSGLRGFGSSFSPYRSQISRQVGPLALAVAKPLIDHSMSDSGWMKRLWTFEEMIVSSHLLVLADDQAFFCCRDKKTIHSEDTYSEVAPGDSISIISMEVPEIDDFWSFHDGWDGGFDVYASLVGLYATRHATREDDLSSGLTAIKLALEDNLGKQYHWDLPVKRFAQALCFSILEGRRRSSAKFPTWSWQGWIVSGPSDLDYESIWGYESPGFPVTFFYASKSALSGNFQYDRLETGGGGLSFEFPDGDCLSPAIIDQLPNNYKEHLLVFNAVTIELFLHRIEEEWLVSLKDGDNPSSNIGSAILNLSDEQTKEGYFKLAFIGYCRHERGGDPEGDDNKFFLVLMLSAYGNVYHRVGCCLGLEIENPKEFAKHEMVYLI